MSAHLDVQRRTPDRYPDITPKTILYIFTSSKHDITEEPSNAARAKNIPILRGKYGWAEYQSGLELSWDKPPASITTGFRIGSDPSCEVYLPASHKSFEGTISVSRVHCRIHFSQQSGLLLLTDCSKTGTQIRKGGESVKTLTPDMPTTLLESHWSIFIGNFYSLTIVIPWTASNCTRYIKELCEQVPTIRTPLTPVPDIKGQAKNGKGDPTDLPFSPKDSKYREWKIVGRGAFARVSLLVDNLTGNLVAGKNPTKGRTKREIVILKKLRNPYIISFIDEIPRPSGSSTLIMEYSPYGDLTRFDLREWSDAEKFESFRQLLSGLRYLHRHQIVHRDIKPENILVTSCAPIHLKFIDFEFSQKLGRDRQVSFLGTIGYVAPECRENDAGRASLPADIYALGITFLSFYYHHYEIFNGLLDHSNIHQYYLGSEWPSQVRRHAKGTKPEQSQTLLCGMTSASPVNRWTANNAHRYATDYAKRLSEGNAVSRPKRKLALGGPNNQKKSQQERSLFQTSHLLST
ncbi:hypothetical protein TWF281_007835 [Arthrobotrys megalospora]